MHHKKHETRRQSTSTSSSSTHHYRLATRSSTLKLNKPIKVKRLIKSSTLRNNDETRLSNKRISECYQHSTPLTTGNIALFGQNTHSSSPLYINRRRQASLGNMTSYTALKRKAQRSDISSSTSRFQVNLEHVLGFTSISNSLVSQDHSTVAYAAGSTVVLYDINTQKQDFIINTARKAITSLSLSPDGRYLATGEGGHDPKVRVWDLTGDKTACIELGDHKFAIDSVCFSPNVDRLVSIGSLHDGNIYVWSWKDKKKLASNKCTCSIRRIAFAEDGSYFVTVGNRHVKFWYLISTASLEVVPLRGRYAILAERKDNFFTDVVCGRGDCAGMTYVITANGLICQFDEHRQLRGERDLQEKTNCLAIGDIYLVVGCAKGAIYIFSPQTLEYIMSIPLPHYLGVDISFITSIDQMTYPQQQNMCFPDTIAVCLDEDKSMLTCFYNDHSFYIWDIKNEKSIKKRDSHMYHSGCAWGIETYSRTNSSPSILRHLTCITCSSDNTIRFWSLNHGEADSYFAPSPVANIFSRQLMKIVYLDEDYSKLCDIQTTQERPEFVPKIGGRCMKINPDGLSLAIGDRNGNIRILDMQTFKQIALVEAHDSEVLSVDYGQSSEMGVTFLASSSRDRFVHVFDITKDYQLVATLDDHSAAITAVRFTVSSITSNLQLISCSADKSLIFRSLSKNENGKYQFVRSNNIVEKQTFYDLAVDHTRELVNTACQDRMIRVYNTQDGKRVRTMKGSMNDDTGYLLKIDIDTSGRYLATSCSNKCVYIWDILTTECVASLCGHSEIVTDLKFSHDGHHLYTISGDSCMFVWNIAELAIVPTICRLQSVPLAKSNDLEITEVEESISQAPSIIEEHQPQSKRQRSLWATAEPRLLQFESKFTRPQLPDIINEDLSDKMIRSASSQDDESVFLDEDDDPTTATITDSTNGKTYSFFKENYDHENLTANTTIDDDEISTRQVQRRKSVSSRFRSVSKEITITESLSTSANTTQEDMSISIRTTKNGRSQIINTIDPRTAPPKSSTTRKTRGNRAQSEDRFRSSTLSLNNAAGDTTSSSSSHSYLPSYAAHTSSSMSKLREGATSSTPPPVPTFVPSTSATSLTMNSQTRRVPSTVSMDTRSLSSSKTMTKSRSTQNLVLPSTSIPQSKTAATLRRVKISRVPRRPPNLPTAPNPPLSSSSSASSNTSSPTKTNQTKENDETKQYVHSTSNSSLPLRELDNTANDLMPKWAQDCFYRTVVLGLKPLLLQDIPSSPNKPTKRSSSTCSVESSDSLETTNELQACTLNDNDNQKEIKIRRSISIPDYRQIKQIHKVLQPSLSQTTMNETKEDESIINDDRIPVINDLADDLHKRLNELENLYSTVSQSSDTRDIMLKQYIEQIFTDLHVRIANNQNQQQQQENEECTTNTTVVVVTE
ncbi:unnamed protein product [Adineta steineri]|uniref:Mitogen-activated protein kinase-binding protein 1 n=1 Tax=Adineta steineri TaxID=433720 RepID=A0A814SD69_9BILA|nr:unnamed protein product [Adineta steineri]CAF3924004.1 unnamed protein product [Adineta steineri]